MERFKVGVSWRVEGKMEGRLVYLNMEGKLGEEIRKVFSFYNF